MFPPHELETIAALSTEAIYNVKAVCMRTGITGATLRAWERRYGVPEPHRSDQGYRLYSERDIAILFWLRRQTSRGMNIAHAVAQLQTLIDVPGVQTVIPPSYDKLRSPAILRREMYQALYHLDESSFERLMNEAMAMYTLETALINILQGAVNDIRDAKTQGRISTTGEYLALYHAQQRLLQMSQTLPNVHKTYKMAITIGVGAEHRELDLMIINILLRRQGIPVRMFGADLSPRLLAETVTHLDAGIILYYADEPQSIMNLIGVYPPCNSKGERVRLVCCGRALAIAPDLIGNLQCEYLGGDLRRAVQTIIDHIQNTSGV